MAVAKVLKEHFGQRQLRGITHSDIWEFRAERLAKPTKAKKQRSIAAVKRELEKLRRLLNIAEREGWILRNPMRGGDPLISIADERKRERILTRDEELRLLSACENRYQNPRRLIDRSAEKNNLRLVKMIIDEDGTRDQLRTEMIEREVRGVHALGLKDVAKYFRTNLNVEWEESWLDVLVIVAARRNEAAHDVRFKAPPIEMKAKELSALLEYGVKIGALCAKTYDVPLDLGWSSLGELIDTGVIDFARRHDRYLWRLSARQSLAHNDLIDWPGVNSEPWKETSKKSFKRQRNCLSAFEPPLGDCLSKRSTLFPSRTLKLPGLKRASGAWPRSTQAQWN